MSQASIAPDVVQNPGGDGQHASSNEETVSCLLTQGNPHLWGPRNRGHVSSRVDCYRLDSLSELGDCVGEHF
nr:unnamed protein product [Callosobruchus chinensis]